MSINTSPYTPFTPFTPYTESTVSSAIRHLFEKELPGVLQQVTVTTSPIDAMGVIRVGIAILSTAEVKKELVKQGLGSDSFFTTELPTLLKNVLPVYTEVKVDLHLIEPVKATSLQAKVSIKIV